MTTQPAHAACSNTAPASNETVTCSPPVPQTTTVDGTGTTNVTVNVLPNASITVGNDTIAILLQDASRVTNAGTITSGDAIGFFSSGIFFQGNNGTAVNNGSIVVGNAAGGQLAAIRSFGNNADITNNNSIVVGNGSGAGVGSPPDAFGIAVADLSRVTNNGSIVTGNFSVSIFACCVNTITNSATGSIRTGDSSFGIFGSDGNTIRNDGQITVGNGAGLVRAYGIVVGGQNNTVTNNGTIRAGDLAGGLGIDDTVTGGGSSLNGNRLINAVSGLIQVGNGSIGINSGSLINPPPAGADLINNGRIITGDSIPGGAFAVGIASMGAANITNTGNITTGNGDVGTPTPVYGIFATADGSNIQNSGTISVGAVGRGIRAGGDASIVNNSGTILGGASSTGIDVVAPTSGPAAGPVGLAITNSGRIVVGSGGIGVNFQDTGTLNNSGLIQATGVGSAAINTCAGLCTVVSNVTNSGTIDGQVLVSGSGSTFVNGGLLTVTDNDATNPVGGFAHIAGETFTQTATGTLALRVTGDVRHDALGGASITSTVNLDGTLRALVLPGLYANATTYPFVVTSGSGGVNGQFSTVTTSSAFFTATATYALQSVDLNLFRTPFGSAPGETPNERAVGTALEGAYSQALTGNAATFYGNLLAASSVTVLDQLSGEGTTATQNAAFGAGSQFNGAMQNQSLMGSTSGSISVTIPAAQYAESRAARGREAFASLKPEIDATQTGRWRIWSVGFAASHSLQGQAATGSSSQSVRNYGGALGFDRQLTPDLLVGFAAGGSESSFSVPNLSTSGQLTGGHLGLYALKTWGAYYAAAALSYSRFDNSTTRQILGIGPGETASGRFASDQISGRLELGWKRPTALGTFTPFVAIEPAALWQHGYTESSATAGGGNGILGLTVASRTATSLPTFVGVQFDTKKTLANGAVFEPFARISWVHEFEPNRQVTAGFVSVPTAIFTVDGARAASDAARIDAGAKLALRGGETMFANFTSEWSGRTESYAGTAGFRVAW